MDLLFSIFHMSTVMGAREVGFTLGSWDVLRLQHSTGRCPSLDSSSLETNLSILLYLSILSEQDQGGGYCVSFTNLIHVQLKYPTSRYYITMIPISTFSPRFTFGRSTRLMKQWTPFLLHSSARQCLP